MQRATLNPVWTSEGSDQEFAQPVDRHPAFTRAMAAIPEPVLRTFTTGQLECLSSVLTPRPSEHMIDWRLSIPFFGRRFYLRMLLGKERRNLMRLLEEGQLDLSKVSIFYTLVTGLLLSIGIIATFTMLYMAKTVIGIDVFDGNSPVHDLFDQFSAH